MRGAPGVGRRRPREVAARDLAARPRDLLAARARASARGTAARARGRARPRRRCRCRRRRRSGRARRRARGGGDARGPAAACGSSQPSCGAVRAAQPGRRAGPSSSSTRALTAATSRGLISPRPMPLWLVTTASRTPAARRRSSAARAPGTGTTRGGVAVVGDVDDQRAVAVEQHGGRAARRRARRRAAARADRRAQPRRAGGAPARGRAAERRSSRPSSRSRAACAAGGDPPPGQLARARPATRRRPAGGARPARAAARRAPRRAGAVVARWRRQPARAARRRARASRGRGGRPSGRRRRCRPAWPRSPTGRRGHGVLDLARAAHERPAGVHDRSARSVSSRYARGKRSSKPPTADQRRAAYARSAVIQRASSRPATLRSQSVGAGGGRAAARARDPGWRRPRGRGARGPRAGVAPVAHRPARRRRGRRPTARTPARQPTLRAAAGPAAARAQEHDARGHTQRGAPAAVVDHHDALRAHVGDPLRAAPPSDARPLVATTMSKVAAVPRGPPGVTMIDSCSRHGPEGDGSCSPSRVRRRYPGRDEPETSTVARPDSTRDRRLPSAHQRVRGSVGRRSAAAGAGSVTNRCPRTWRISVSPQRLTGSGG